MNYELAKRLKDAGFPQGQYRLGNRIYPNTDEYEEDGAHIPTLSELIEACGDRFDYLERGVDGCWYAYHEVFPRDDKDLSGDIFGKGSTACEAVALLWLALNDKK